MKTKILSFMLIASSIFLFSCKEEDNFTPGSLKQNNVTLYVGESVQLSYSGTGEVWQSGNTQIASVTDDGVVTGVHVGKTLLRVNWSTCEVEVKSKNNFFVDPILNDFDIRKSDVNTFYKETTFAYSKNGVLSYSDAKIPSDAKTSAYAFEMSSDAMKKKFEVYDAQVFDPADEEQNADKKKKIDINYNTEFSPEKDAELNEKYASMKSVMRSIYMYEKGSEAEIAAMAMVVDYSNKDFLYNYISDRYNTVSDNGEDEKEYKSIDGNIVVKTAVIAEQSRDANYNYITFNEKAYAVAMFVPATSDVETVMEELVEGVKESYYRKPIIVTIGVSNGQEQKDECGTASIKTMLGAELQDGQLINRGKAIITATAAEGYKFAGWAKEVNPSSVVSTKEVDTIQVNADVEKDVKYYAVFEKPFTFKLEVSAGGSATISYGEEIGKNELAITQFDEVTFTAVAAEGYKFAGWVEVPAGNVKSDEQLLKDNMKSATEEFKGTVKNPKGATEVVYKAIFEVAKYNVSVNLEGGTEDEEGTEDEAVGTISGVINTEPQGKMEMDKDGKQLKNTSDVKFGNSVTLTAVETNNKYKFDGWYQNNEIISAEKEFTFVAVSDTVLSAKFSKKIFNVKVQAEAYEGKTAGTVTPTSKKVEINEKIEIEAKPKKGYVLDKWINVEGTEVSTDNPAKITITQDSIFKAIFKKETFDINISTQGEGSVKAEKVDKEGKVLAQLSLDAANVIEYGDMIKLSVTEVAENKYFAGWKIGNVIASTEKEYTITITEKVDILAAFETNAFNLKITASEGGTVEGNDHPRVKYGEPTTFTVKANDEYELVSLLANGEEIVNAESHTIDEKKRFTYTTEPLTGVVIYHAVFAKVKYDVTVVATGGGTVTPKEKVQVTSGEQITITATAAEGYEFVNWTSYGIEVSKNATYTTAPIIGADKEYKANFGCKVAIVAGEGGKVVTGNLIVVVGEQTTIQAIADEGYEFVNWTVDGEEVSKESSYSATITKETEFVANFKQKEEGAE